MQISKIDLICFSPTRTTHQVLKGISRGFPGKAVEDIDITYPGNTSTRLIPSDELAIIGVPVYAGRVAPLAAERLKRIEGKNTPAVIVVVYGNREYEDALLELKDLVEASGFIPLAGCTFIGEHSYSEDETPIGAGRPDEEDLEDAHNYGSRISTILNNISQIDNIGELQVPGNRPYKDGLGNMPFGPVVDMEICSRCGECLAGCPTGAISLSDQIDIEITMCIFCCSCKKSCPEMAISIEAQPIREKMVWLSQNCSKRKKPQLFLLMD